ncbi:copper transport protein ctr1 [Phlyctochytrium planicorne]|nr:copper transport protein ctr1 [Phlyctochytrium planicorne]
MDPSFAEAIIPPSQVTDIASTPFASGGSAVVFRARYDGANVVIKRMQNSAGLHLLKDFQSEVATQIRLNHTRIVRLYGIMTEELGGISLVLEDMTHGSLFEYYRKNPDPKPSIRDRIQWALDVSYGIQYLHGRNPPIIHRDLKSPNILMSTVEGRLCAKVSDFGSAMRQLSTASQISSKANTLNGTTVVYRAPELNGIRIKFTTASDVYAFGIILSEIASWEGPFGCPWSELNFEALQTMHSQGKSVPIDLDESDVPHTFKDLAQKCAADNKKDRPSISEVTDVLKSLSGHTPLSEGKTDSSSSVSIHPVQDTVSLSETHASTSQFGIFETLIPGSAITQTAARPPNKATDSKVPTEGWITNSLPKTETVKVFEEFRLKAENGNKDSQYWMGLQYFNGSSSVDEDLESAFKWLRLSAEGNHPEAHLLLKEIEWLRDGDGKVPFKEYLGLAEQGDAMHQLIVGVCYENGKCVPQNFEEAAKWYARSAKSGNNAAQHALGVCYYNGVGVQKNTSLALKWFTEAAKAGNASAQFDLGVFYDTGRGVEAEKNPWQAVKWFTKAAELGFASAQYNLGVCYFKGQGVKKDEKEAVKWFLRAAEQGNDSAQCFLGVCYQNGQGVEKDFQQAAKWYTLSARAGNTTAQSK